MNGFIGPFIDNQLDQLKRTIRINYMTREMRLLDMELKALALEYSQTNNGMNIYYAIGDWLSSNNDVKKLGKSVYEFAAFLKSIYLPIVSYHHPNIRSSNDNIANEIISLQEELDDLIELKLYDSFEDYANSLASIGGTIKNLVGLSRAFSRGPEKTLIGLRFPNPKEAGAYEIQKTTNLKYLLGDMVLGEMIWNAIEKGSSFEIKFDYNKMYSRNFQLGTIGCEQNTPIVNKIAVYFVNNNEQESFLWNGIFSRSNIYASVDTEQDYVQNDRIVRYSLDNKEWINHRVEFHMGSMNDLSSTLNQSRVTSTIGMTPFTGFNINLGITNNSEFQSVKDNISEVVVLMDVSTTPTYSMSIPPCQ